MSQTHISGTPPPGRSRKTLFVVLSVTGVALVMIFGCLGVNILALGSARKAARLTVNMQHLETIGKALEVYARANGGALPEAATGWEPRLGLPGKTFAAPGESSGQTAFVYVPGYNRNDFQRGRLTGAEIMLYLDPRIDSPQYPVLFVDGRTTLLRRDELERLIKATPRPVYP